MRYAAIVAASLTAVGLAGAVSGPAQAGREDRAQSYASDEDREEMRRAVQERKWRRYAYEREQRKRYRGAYRYSYPWGPWGPFAGPPGL